MKTAEEILKRKTVYKYVLSKSPSWVVEDIIEAMEQYATQQGREEEYIRPSVMKFARAMEGVLRKNDHKTGWKDMNNWELIERVEQELEELKDADNRMSTRLVINEAIDVANFCMMIFDNNTPPPTGKGARE